MKKTGLFILVLMLSIQVMLGCGNDGKNDNQSIVPANVTIQIPEGL